VLVGIALEVGETTSVSDKVVVETAAVAIRLGVVVRAAVGLCVPVGAGVAVEEGAGVAGMGVPAGVAGAAVAGASVAGELNARSGIWLHAASERMQARPRRRERNTAGRKDDMRGKVLR
jgi:hypothetical protein